MTGKPVTGARPPARELTSRSHAEGWLGKARFGKENYFVELRAVS